MARPPMDPALRARILEAHRADPGASLRALAELVGSSKDSVRRVLRAAALLAVPPAVAEPATPLASAAGYPNLSRRVVFGADGRAGWDERRTRTEVLFGRRVEVDESGRLFCDCCLRWLPVEVATARGSSHRAVPGVSFRWSGMLLPLGEDWRPAPALRWW